MRVLAGRYELERELGSGGMGAVYRAVDRELERAVAVKVLSEQLARQPGFLARFQREARVAAGLSHPHLVVVHDVGQDVTGEHPVPYLVMELVQGRTLAEILRGGPLAPDRAAAVVLDVLDALEHCHAKGVVHRDIKPANIMLDESGSRPVVKVMDFGIARLLSEEATRLTATGMLIGTPAYLSPEQADGRPVLPASDLYSLGCVLYELLTGRPPFAGGNPAGVLMGHLLRTPPAPSTLRAELPPVWDQVILSALAKDPQERYATAADMRAALLDALGPATEPTTATWDRIPRRSAVPAQRLPPDDEPPPTTPGTGQPSAHPSQTAPPGTPPPAYSPQAGQPPVYPPQAGGLPASPRRTAPPAAATVATGLSAALERRSDGLARAAAVLAAIGFILYLRALSFERLSPMDAPPFTLFFPLMTACSAAILNRRARLPAAAAVFGSTPGWTYLLVIYADRIERDPWFFAMSVLAVAMCATAGAVAIGDGLTTSPARLALGLAAPAAVLSIPFILWGLPPGDYAAAVILACVLGVLVLGLSACFRTRPAVTAAVAGALTFMVTFAVLPSIS
ncbi:protein kinase domain-containing protein [Actinomadura atramentaria]|uniref:protein kinase domain-containing protein n=1 Tax=Actinomadura atramentaria TaxID=1990 RepID=UPI00068613C4|nr:protein kinase [Actinomadura atramentaria]